MNNQKFIFRNKKVIKTAHRYRYKHNGYKQNGYTHSYKPTSALPCVTAASKGCSLLRTPVITGAHSGVPGEAAHSRFCQDGWGRAKWQPDYNPEETADVKPGNHQ